MSDLHARIRAAQINAGELAVVADLHERGICDPKTCPLCEGAFKEAITAKEPPPMSKSLEDKLAVMVWYLEEVRQGRRGSDPKAFESYLDDAEVAAWLDDMKKRGRVTNTRFTEPRR